MSTLNAEELAHEVVQMNRAIVRCLHYLAEEIPESRRGDYLLLLKDVHNKQTRLAHTLDGDTDVHTSDHATVQSISKRVIHPHIEHT